MKSVWALVMSLSWSIAALAAGGKSFMPSLYAASFSKVVMGAPFLLVGLVGTSNHSESVSPRLFTGGAA